MSSNLALSCRHYCCLIVKFVFSYLSRLCQQVTKNITSPTYSHTLCLSLTASCSHSSSFSHSSFYLIVFQTFCSGEGVHELDFGLVCPPGATLCIRRHPTVNSLLGGLPSLEDVKLLRSEQRFSQQQFTQGRKLRLHAGTRFLKWSHRT